MSLHTAAQHLAGAGRFKDSMLVHMSPKEFERISSFASSLGKNLTVNPKTGLPEMGVLDGIFDDPILGTILPIVAGVALNAALPGVGALGAGAIVGGGTWAATGDIKRGLAAGLGAYGGAGLGSSLGSYGATSAVGADAAAAGSQTGATQALAAAPEAASTATGIGSTLDNAAMSNIGQGGITGSVNPGLAETAFNSSAGEAAALAQSGNAGAAQAALAEGANASAAAANTASTAGTASGIPAASDAVASAGDTVVPIERGSSFGNLGTGTKEAISSPSKYYDFYTNNGTASLKYLPPGSAHMLGSYLLNDSMGGSKGGGDAMERPAPYDIDTYSYDQATYNPAIGSRDTGENRRFQGTFRKK